MSIIGNATLIILICYVLASLSTKQKISMKDILSNCIILIILHLILLR